MGKKYTGGEWIPVHRVIERQIAASRRLVSVVRARNKKNISSTL